MKPRREEGWYAIRVRSQTELAARKALRRAGVDAVVLTSRWVEKRASRHAKRRIAVERPSVPGYVVIPARSAGDAWALVHEHPYLRSVVSNRPIPDADLRRLEAELNRDMFRVDSITIYAINQRVRFHYGNKTNVGILKGIAADIARVAIEAFGGEVEVNVPLANLAAA